MYSRGGEPRGVHFARALAAVKSHCFRYWNTRDERRERGERRAENTIARVAPRTTRIMHTRTYTRVYTTCYKRIAAPPTWGVATQSTMYSVSCYAAGCVSLPIHPLLFRIPSILPVSYYLPLASRARTREYKCIRTHSASLAPFY